MVQVKTSIGRDFQDVMLGRLAASGYPATIYLRNRMSLRGRIVDFDPYVLVLEPRDGSPVQMVYKSAIVSISGPPRPGPRGRGGPGGPGGPRRFGPPAERPYGPRQDYGPPRRPDDGGPPRSYSSDAPPRRYPEEGGPGAPPAGEEPAG